MFGKLREWANVNNIEITWFLIGVLVVSTLDALARGQYIWAVISVLMIWLNYFFRKSRF